MIGMDAPKIVFAGPVGAGKTTAIRSVSDSAPIATEVPMLEEIVGDKDTTTVALDFSTIELDDGTVLHVFGLPGQEHFSFMRAIVLTGAMGVVLVLNGADPAIADECHRWVEAVRENADEVAMVVGITQTDKLPEFDLGAVRAVLRRCQVQTPVLTFDAREPEQTLQVLRSLLAVVMAEAGG